jgi:uncharacterized membrane protein YphA (DoxX/SURF4 family)
LAGVFIYGGWDAMRHPNGKVKAAEPVVLPIAEKVPILPQDAERLVQINGAVMVGAGTLMALGKFRRLAALALIGSIIPTTYAGHRFWEEDDEATRAQQRIHFLKNLGLLGGLILEVLDTEGSPSVRWKVAHRSRKRDSNGGLEMAKHISGGIDAAQELLSQAAAVSGPAISGGIGAAQELLSQAAAASGPAISGRIGAAQELLSHAAAASGPAISGRIGAAQELLSHAAATGGPAISQARDVVTRLPELGNRALKKA